MKQFAIFTLVSLMVIGLCRSVLGATIAKNDRFSNIVIETLGSQNYDLKSNTVTVTERVKMTIDEEVVIEADSMIYYGNERMTIASGNIRMTNKNQVTLTAIELVFDHGSGWVKASGNAQFSSPHEAYYSEIINYNVNDLTGTVGALEGIIKGQERNFYLYGTGATLEKNATIISKSGLTRCPNKDFPDYIFNAKVMRIVGDDIQMEKVLLRVLGGPALYLPKLTLKQGEQAPRFDASANDSDEPEFDNSGTESQSPPPPEPSQTSPTQSANQETSQTVKSNSAAAAEEVRRNWRYRIEVNTTRPSKIAIGRGYRWGRYSNSIDLEVDSRGVFGVADRYQIRFLKKYYLAVDGRTELVAEPDRELGITLYSNTIHTEHGDWQAGLLSRLIFRDRNDQTYQGVYGAYRLDYQLNDKFNCSYFYLDDLSGSERDWQEIEPDFLIIKNYRLGGNFIYNLTLPITDHYSFWNKGSYNFQDGSWTSQVSAIIREVCCVRAALGWDFAKEIVEIRFKVFY